MDIMTNTCRRAKIEKLVQTDKHIDKRQRRINSDRNPNGVRACLDDPILLLKNSTRYDEAGGLLETTSKVGCRGSWCLWNGRGPLPPRLDIYCNLISGCY